VGGKLLTNYLKELITHRQWNMMDDTFVVNQVKEELCFCAQDFVAELASAKAAVSLDARRAAAEAGVYPGLLREFVLPDYHSILKGYVKVAPAPPAQPEPATAVVASPAHDAPAPLQKNDKRLVAEKKGKKATLATGKRKRHPRKGDGSDEELELEEYDDEDGEDDDDMKAEEIAKLKALEAQAEAEKQVLVMNNERISVPEILFHPIDVGMY
jgi:hypothetical protein